MQLPPPSASVNIPDFIHSFTSIVQESIYCAIFKDLQPMRKIDYDRIVCVFIGGILALGDTQNS